MELTWYSMQYWNRVGVVLKDSETFKFCYDGTPKVRSKDGVARGGDGMVQVWYGRTMAWYGIAWHGSMVAW